jgi:hypothetical protein
MEMQVTLCKTLSKHFQSIFTTFPEHFQSIFKTLSKQFQRRANAFCLALPSVENIVRPVQSIFDDMQMHAASF